MLAPCGSAEHNASEGGPTRPGPQGRIFEQVRGASELNPSAHQKCRQNDWKGRMQYLFS